MVRITSQILLLVSIATAGCVGFVGRDGHSNSIDSIRDIKGRLSEVRGLVFTADVPIMFETKEALKERIKAEFEAGLGHLKREELSLAYAKLGLSPSEVDLRSSLLNYYAAQALGFYNSTTKSIALLARQDSTTMSNVSLNQETSRILVHELTHALQDQHFSLAEKLRPSQNGDEILALRAVAEADAILTEYAYRFGGLEDWVVDYVHQVVAAEPHESEFSDITAVVMDKMRFQHSAGMNFVARLSKRHGWLPVNLAYFYPPLSTEQILHPEKYFARPDPPTRIGLKGLGALFSLEWRSIENDTLGELLVQCLFKQYLSAADAALVANGWDGDRFVAFRNGDEVAFIWATVWDSLKDAGEFYDNYQKILSVKYSSRSFDSRFYIEIRGLSVIVVEGLDLGRVESNIGAIWSQISHEEEMFNPPPVRSLIGSH